MRVNTRRRWMWGLLLLSLLLGTALRFYRLDAQSFWHDEGNTARLVERSLRLIVEGAAGDIHPPGYYLLLCGWSRVMGTSEFALRSFSVLCGVLTIAVAAAIGRRAGGWAVAAGAALFMALHPLAVYYSQEARMYALLGLASALTLWAAGRLVAALQDANASAPLYGPTVLLALSIALGLYTQYAFAFVILGINLAFGLTWLVRRPWRWSAFPAWVAAHMIGGAAFLPWLPNVSKLTRWRPPDLNTGEALVDMPHTLLSGVTLPIEVGAHLLPIAGGLFFLALLRGLALLQRGSRRPWTVQFAAWSALFTAVTPTLLIAVLNVYRPAYLKFLMASVAPLAVALALPLRRGVARWPHCLARGVRLLAALLLAALVPTQVDALRNLYFDPAYARDDYRGIAAQVAAEAGPHDGILLNAPNQWEVFTYYYKGPLEVYPAPYHPTEEEARSWIAEILRAQHPTLFVLYWGDNESDPDRLIERELAQQAYKAGEVWIGDIRMAVYGRGPQPERPDLPLEAKLGEEIRLEGYALPVSVFAPGDIIPVTLFWQAPVSPGSRMKVFVHLMDASGQLRAQTDAEPVGGFRPTTTWQPGEMIIDRYGLRLPEDLPSGHYSVNVGLYDASGTRLRVMQEGQPSGDTLSLGTVSVQ